MGLPGTVYYLNKGKSNLKPSGTFTVTELEFSLCVVSASVQSEEQFASMIKDCPSFCIQKF